MLIASAVVDGFLLSEAIIVAIGLVITYAKWQGNQAERIFVKCQSLILVSVDFVRKLTKWSNLGLTRPVYISTVSRLLSQSLLSSTKFRKHGITRFARKSQVEVISLSFVNINETKTHLKPPARIA